MRFEQVTIVGVGLIGGSVGLAVRARGLAARVVGVAHEPDGPARALAKGAVDSVTTDLPAGVREADLVVVCTPVDRIATTILAAAPHVRSGTILTDVGSTKEAIVRAVGQGLPEGVHFVPAHPLAGSEKSGVENARADLFEGRLVVLTGAADGPDPRAEERVRRFWEGLGARVVRMASPRDHDRAVAATSHLPHAVAAAVVRGVPRDWLAVCGPGFRDVTRVAAGDPHLWAAIFLSNREPVLAALARFREQLDRFGLLLERGDGAGLAAWLAEAKRGRDAVGS